MSKKSKKPIFKNIPFEIKEIGAEGLVEGHAGVFNNIDFGDDIIEPGAFKKTIKESGGHWPVLKDHMPSIKLGFNIEAREDDKGLFVIEQLSLDVQAGKEQFALTKLAHSVGASDGLSIGFMPIKAVPDKDRPVVRRLKEIKMFEHSHVTFPMNQEAFTNAAKNWNADNNKDLGIDEHTDLFFNHMEYLGYDYSEILEVLHKYEAANQSTDPDEIIQSIDKAIRVLKGA